MKVRDLEFNSTFELYDDNKKSLLARTTRYGRNRAFFNSRATGPILQKLRFKTVV